MKRALQFAIPSVLLGSALAFVVTAQTTAPEVTLTRLDCGGAAAPVDVARFSDTNALEGKKVALTASCYLIKHGDEYMLWDAGYPAAAPGAQATPPSPKVSLVEQLAQLKLTPEQIKFVGISHYHGDHIGQAASFPGATLLIGKGDWDALTAEKPAQGVNPAPVAHWISGGGKSEAVPRDKDVFGDGTVVMLDMPGHTPGHHSLLVKLKTKGNVLLSGDLVHLKENYDTSGVPSFNTNRADTLASLDRFKKMATNLKATVIIQHDPRDTNKLPAFPASAN
jgi:glyoxylase-like metal-dependent hydrolase (beta-lactamase superfamily II)